jgi:hypothetical protein
MGILDRGIEKWAVKLQAEEMSEFVSRLESMGGPEIGLGFAMATHWRNSLSLKRELMDPIYYVSVNPMVGHEFGKMVRKLQQRGRNFEAIGLMVWLHTLRAASSQELRGPGRRMWKELARGVPFAHESAASYLFMTGTVLETDYSALYPEGFIPEPV